MPTTLERVENVLLVVQTGAVHPEVLRGATGLVATMSSEGPFAALVHITGDTALPGSREREAIQGFHREVARAGGITALVIDGTGFFAATMRGVGTAMSTASGQPIPIHKSCDEALTMLGKRLGHAPALSDVMAVVQKTLAAPAG